MATKVDLDKVKKIIKNSFYETIDQEATLKYGSLAGDANEYIGIVFSELDKLAYGKTYECWSCGKPIYASELEKKWIHVDTGKRLCVIKSAMSDEYISDEYISVSNYAIPKPEDIESSVAHHAECVYCGQRVYYANGAWYHCETGESACKSWSESKAPLHRAIPKPTERKVK